MPLIDLIRHGQSEANVFFELTQGVDTKMLDARLTAFGKQQAAELGVRLASKHYDLVLVSPLTRAIETAITIFAGRDIPFHVHHVHAERLEDSADVGRKPHLLKADFPHLDFSHLADVWWHDHEERNEHGFAVETQAIFEERIKAFVDHLRARTENSIAVIGHGAFFQRLTGRWMQNCELQAFDPHSFGALYPALPYPLKPRP